jgi:hypothetical protein
MSTKHTEGRLVVSSTFLVCNEEAKIVAQCQPMLEVPELAPSVLEAEANARRLVACWNACEGISTEDLEKPMEMHVTLAISEAAAARRDELLKALRYYEAIRGPVGEPARLALSRLGDK